MMHTYDSVVPAFPFHFLWCNGELQSSLTARDLVPEVVDSASNPKNGGQNVDSKTHLYVPCMDLHLTLRFNQM